MLEVTVVLKAVGGAVEALRAAGQRIKSARLLAADVRDAKRMLGLADPVAEAYRSDAVHPLFTPGELHPDNKAALLAAGTDLMDQDLIHRDSLVIDATESSLLLVGSPISDGLSRIIFGYSELPDREGLSLDRPQFDLFYTWDLDPERVGRGSVRRFVPGRGLIERPPWQIRDLRGGTSPRLVPQTDSDGLLLDDYLLITRIPNFLSSTAESTGQFLVSFGGAHGTGTRAINLLFKDKKLMARVVEELRKKNAASTSRITGVPPAYQLLFRVSRIKHGPRGSIPGSLELLDAVVLDDDEGAWDAARRHITPRLNPGSVTPTADPKREGK